MANLSNINNKFLVTTGGNVLIGQTADDGNRLQIDGDAIIKNGTYGKILLRSSSNYLYGDANGVLIAAASDNLRLYTAGTQRLIIDSSGKVIINDNTIGDKLLLAGDNAGTARGLMFNCSTTTNQGDTWDIDAQSSTGIIKFSTGSSERMRIDSSGTVTIKNPTTSNLQLQSDQTTWVQNDVISNLNTYVSDTSAAGARDVAAIKVVNDQVGTNTTMSGVMTFYTSAYNAQMFERMRINGLGDVGIGTTLPLVRLQLERTVSNATSRQAPVNLIYLTSEHPSVGYTGFGTAITHYSRTYQNSAKTEQSKIAFTQQGDSVSTAGSTIDFYTKTLSTGSATPEMIMRINYNGNVGIGATNPFAKLEVTGSRANNWAGRFENTNSIGYGILAKINSTDSSDYIFQARTGATNVMTILGDGNVGIGTTSPETDLMIYDTVNEDPAEPGFATTGMFALNRSGQATLSMGVGANNSFWMSNVNRAFTGPNYYNISLNPLGGRVGVGTTTPSSKLSVFGTQAAIDFQRGTGDSKWEFSSDAARFYIAEMSTGTRDYIMTLEETTGRVGIGETSPKAPLNITGVSLNPVVPTAASSSGILRIESGNGGVSLDIGSQGSAPYSMWMQVGNTSNNTGDVYPILLNPLGGNVGIGETSPSAKLHVKSTANADVIFKLENTNTGTSAGAKIELIDDEGGSGSGAGALRHSISSISQTVGNWIIGSGAAAGQLQFSTVDAFAMMIDEEQNVLIGTTTVTSVSKLQLTSSNAYYGFVDRAQVSGNGSPAGFFNSAGSLVGSISTNNTSTTYITSSDYRLKEDLQDFAGLDMVSKIPVYDFKWKTDESRSYGVMAHELQDVLPDAVSGEKDAEEMQGVDYSKIVPLLVKSIQELEAKIKILENK